MQRRTYLLTLLSLPASVSAQPKPAHPVQLHVDLTVDPAREKEMLDNFHRTFQPAASKQPGFIDVKMCKLRTTLMGKAPDGVNYRFVLTFASEPQRQAWVATDLHQQVWPTIEKTLVHKNYNVLLYDIA